MLRSRIIPSLLLDGLGLVKTRKFGDSKYIGDPINAVRIFNEKNVDELSVFDIRASQAEAGIQYSLLERIAAVSRMPLCYGGGIKSEAEALKLISIGFEKVSISSGGIEDPSLVKRVAETVGRQSLVVTIDYKESGLSKKPVMYVGNGKRKVKRDIFEHIAEVESLGAGEIVLNSISRDGMKTGYDIELAKKVRSMMSLPLTVLGGCGSAEDMRELCESVACVGAAAGSFFVFQGRFDAVLISYSRP